MVDLPPPELAKEVLRRIAYLGIGSIAGPALVNIRAFLEGRARITSANADAEVRRIGVEADAENLPIIAKSQAEALDYLIPEDTETLQKIQMTRDDIVQSIEFQGRKHIANGLAIVAVAADKLGDKEVPYHEPDADWASRFFDYAKDVSSEEMQDVWGRILAGEVETPGRTSLRTLSILRDMPQRNAKAFFDLMEFNISGFILEQCVAEATGKDLTREMLRLIDSSLAYPVMVASNTIIIKDDGIIDKEYHNILLRIEGPPGTELDSMDLSEMLLTPQGVELSHFCHHNPNFAYLSSFARLLESKGCSLKFAPIKLGLGGNKAFTLDELRPL